MASERICVIIRHQKSLIDTLACLHSLSNVLYPRFTTLVLHNHDASDAVSKIREQFPRTLLSLANAPLQSAASYNSAIEWALSKPFAWIFLLSNEAIVDPHCLSELLQEAKANPLAKIFGPKILDPINPTRILHLGGAWDAKQAIYNSFCKSAESIDYASLDAFFMHRSVPHTIGFFEPKYQRFWEDIDFCYRAKRKGLFTKACPSAKIWCKEPAFDPYFWFYGRLLWMKRNLAQNERERIYKEVIRPELQKNIYEAAWLFLLRLFFCATQEQRKKYRQLYAKISAWANAKALF